jgi:hypothetical protein
MSGRRRSTHDGSIYLNECAFETDVCAFLSTEWPVEPTDRPSVVDRRAFLLHGRRIDITGRAFRVERSRTYFEERAFGLDERDVCFERRSVRR